MGGGGGGGGGWGLLNGCLFFGFHVDGPMMRGAYKQGGRLDYQPLRGMSPRSSPKRRLVAWIDDC